MSNAKLNDMVINLGRSLLQYLNESWLWTTDESAAQTIQEMAARQKEHTAALVNLLESMDHDVDHGTYPTEYTDLHYLSLDFVIGQLINNQESIVSSLKSIHRSALSSEGGDLIDRIQSGEQAILESLQALTPVA